MLPMLAPEPATTSAIVAALNPRVAKTSVAASRIRRWVAPVLAQRRAWAEVAIPSTLTGAQAATGPRYVGPGGYACPSGIRVAAATVTESTPGEVSRDD